MSVVTSPAAAAASDDGSDADGVVDELCQSRGVVALRKSLNEICRISIAATYILSLFGSKLRFSRALESLYGAFWRCSRVRL